MLKFLSEYVSVFEKNLNVDLMNKSADRPLVEFIKESWKSLEVLKNIKILKFEYNDRESEIDINKHIFKRDKKKKKKERVDFKLINDDRNGCLTTTIHLTVPELDPKTREIDIKEEVITKDMLIPIVDEDGYLFINGKKYYLIFQLVDSSSYTAPKSSVVLKSLMPVQLQRSSMIEEEIVKDSTAKKDIKGNEFILPIFNVSVFKKKQNVLLFFLANGIDWALSFLGVDNVLKLVTEIPANDDTYTYFHIFSKNYIRVPTELLIRYQYLQGIVGMLLDITTNRTTLEDFYSREYWLKKISNNNTVEKGEDILVFFNRLMDETTKKILRLNSFAKDDVYHILRWMMQNFNELRLKDNMSLYNKRLRCNEIIAALCTEEFSKRLTRVMGLGGKATMRDFKDLFKFSGDRHMSPNLSNCGDEFLVCNY